MIALTLTQLTPAFLLIGLCTQYCYVSLAESLLQPRFRFRLHRLLTAAILTAVIILPGLQLPSSLRVKLCAAMYLLLPFACYHGRNAARLLVFALWLALFPSAEMLCVRLAPFLGVDIADLAPLQQLLLDGLCAFITWTLYLVLRGAIHIIEDRLDRRLWCTLAVTALAMVGTSIVLSFVAYAQQGLEVTPWVSRHLSTICALAIFLPLIALLGLFSLIHQLNRSIRESEEARLMEQQARAELRQVQTVLDGASRYRQLRHDICNHLLAIDALGQKGEYERQHEYLSSLNAAFAQTRAQTFCGHPLIDSLLDAKQLRMRDCGIDVRWNLHPVPESLEISDLDLCALVGNLLDNAIEACERLDAGEMREIQVSLRIVGSALLLRVVNSCRNAHALEQRMHTFSQKRNGPGGMGLKSMRRIVKNCGGELFFRPGEDDASMSVSVYLPDVVK